MKGEVQRVEGNEVELRQTTERFLALSRQRPQVGSVLEGQEPVIGASPLGPTRPLPVVVEVAELLEAVPILLFRGQFATGLHCRSMFSSTIGMRRPGSL